MIFHFSWYWLTSLTSITEKKAANTKISLSHYTGTGHVETNYFLSPEITTSS
ncbi:hypothetical protein PACTADRAFT_74720 [Pachysolen tannophilus NRRL Y-2460]|uniref:Uncharacterized protein n=1 Tax=Pachysolen tannophilus NRRL Y-2460 TaxID=669874 RepID=A0A1E4TZG5_PACTA|nr:hypothetical protein PACTADRAFT_74720 [Pachysolen tannophilus NRRL Y-2460]